jgi:hypothetical protein
MGRSGLPRRRVCPDCGAQLHERAWRHQSKRCPRYSDLWAMDVYVCFGENLKAHGTEAVLFSITAPGADELPGTNRRARSPAPIGTRASSAARSKRDRPLFGTSRPSIGSQRLNAKRRGGRTWLSASWDRRGESASACPGGSCKSEASFTRMSYFPWAMPRSDFGHGSTFRHGRS